MRGNNTCLQMKPNISSLSAVLLSLLIVSAIAAIVIARRITPPRTATRTTTDAAEAYGKLPLSFEDKSGQANQPEGNTTGVGVVEIYYVP
jgi:hypothetical protein